MSLTLLFQYLMLNMFRMLIHPSSGACDLFVELLHGLYCQMNSTMTLLKPLSNPSLLLPYEQYYIQSLQHEGKLISEQSPGEIKPLFQTVINPQPPHST